MNPRLSWSELERRCQKPDWRRQGNWMARRIARPLALRLTRVAIPCGVSAHAATWTAWAVALCGAGGLASGNLTAALLGVVCWQLWYLLDHVDGQLARFRGTASLDGVQLDYLMHHSLNLTMPLALGCGVVLARQSPIWLLMGFVASWALSLLGLLDDTRYKAQYQRLKRLRGQLLVQGGGTSAATAPLPPPRRLVLLLGMPPLGRLLRKLCEVQVQMNLWTLAILAEWNFSVAARQVSAGLLTLTTLAAVLALAGSLARSQRRQAAEAEFARWYRPAEGQSLEFREGYWHVVPAVAVEAEVAADGPGRAPIAASSANFSGQPPAASTASTARSS